MAVCVAKEEGMEGVASAAAAGERAARGVMTESCGYVFGFIEVVPRPAIARHRVA
jgi:hypothetical protein